MGHSYEKSKKVALRLIIFLAIITVVEVLLSLLGKGHIIDGFTFSPSLLRFLMIAFSVVKAFYIVGEFMHLKYEVKGMGKTVLIPLILLPWGVIAFLSEGSSWLANKEEMSTDSNKYVQRLKSANAHDTHDTHTKHIDAHGHKSELKSNHDDHGHKKGSHDEHNH